MKAEEEMIKDEGARMKRKYQVVIPKRIREELGIEAGQKFEIILYENQIEFIPVHSPQEMRGFLKGIETTVERESDRL